MRLFDPENHRHSPRNARLYAIYELIYTAVDFTAAVLFVVGSVLFLDDHTQRAGTWLFLVGSVCFALRPSVHLLREIHFWRIGSVHRLADLARR